MRTLQRIDPFTELNTLHNQVNSLFNDAFGNWGDGRVMPAVDVYNDEQGTTIEAHLPHFKEEEIAVNQLGEALEINAAHQEKDEDKENGRTYIVRQSSSRFYRRFALPKNADTGKLSATFENGMLTVHVPHRELPAPKKVAINSGSQQK